MVSSSPDARVTGSSDERFSPSELTPIKNAMKLI